MCQKVYGFCGLVALTALTLFCGCNEKKEPSQQSTGTPRSAPTSTVQIQLPASANRDQLPELTATALTNLNELRGYDDGDGLVTATRFGPAGTDLPAGTTITWKLPTKMEVGDQLFIATLDEATGKWLNTGELARVVEPGDRATGLVHHFTILGLSIKQPILSEDTDDRKRYAYINVATFSSSETVVVEGKKLDEVKQIYENWAKGAGPEATMDLEVMRSMYEAGDFDTVKTLIENDVISNKHSLDMADLRTALILETTGKICAEKGWKIYRSDSGNQNSGMRSDIDQTIYVYERGADGEWIRAETKDAEFQELFAEKFPEDAKMSLADLDVATIAGKDKYPDPRRLSVQIEAEAGRPFAVHAADTMGTLRKTPGAYTYCGAVVQQMQLRAAAAIDQNLRNIGPENISRKAIDRLATMLGENGVNNLVCNAISSDDQGKLVVHEVSVEEARKVMFDGLSPLLQRGHAYDAAVANYIEYTHHLNDDKPAYKYLLRALDDGVSRLKRLKLGEDATGGEYETLTKKKRLERLRQAIGQYPEMQGMVKRWGIVIDASAELRLKHKKGELTDADFKTAFEPLAREIAGPGGDWESKLPEARAEFDRRSQEFMMHNIIATGTQRAFEYIALDLSDASGRHPIESVIDEPKLRASLGMEGKEFDADWDKVKNEILKNQAEMARLQLLYSFREMRPDIWTLNPFRKPSDGDVVSNIIKYAKIQGMKGKDLKKLKDLAAESRSMFFGYNRYQELKPLYHRIWKTAGKVRVQRAIASFKNHIMMQSGWIDIDARSRTGAGGKLALDAIRFFTRGTVDAHRINDGMTEFFKKHRAPGITSRYIRSAVVDVGNIDAGLSVMRTWSETNGDIEATKAAMQREAISSLPIIGQVYNVAQSGDVGEAAKTASIMTVCMAVPQAGVAALTYSMLENSYVIYQHEVSRPLANKIADALYRGYVGPSLYSYERTPAEFTEEDQKRLTELESEEASEDENQRANRAIELSKLRQKRADWKAYDTERRKRKTWESGALWGIGAQYTQRRFEGPTILDRIEPVIFYAPSPLGPVDFTVKPLNQEQKSRKKYLEAIAQATEVEGVSWQDQLAELHHLRMQQAMYQRAQKILARAQKNHELMHQIRRDSIWPWMVLKTEDRSMLDALPYARLWRHDNKEAIAKGLAKFGSETEVSTAAAAELGTRLLDDLGRSRMLWNAREFSLKQQQLAETGRHERRKAAWFGEALAKVAREKPIALLSKGTQSTLKSAGVDPKTAVSLKPLAAAIIDRHVPEVVPEIEVWVRKVPIQDEKPDPSEQESASTGEEPTKFEYRPSVKVTADPKIYQPPYRAATYQLDPETAQQTASARNFKGLPIDENTVKILQAYAKEWSNKSLTTIDPILLTFAFCDTIDIPERVVRATVEDLPIPPLVTIPNQDVKAYLLGGTSSEPAEDPSDVEIGPVHIKRGYRLTYDHPRFGDYTVIEVSMPIALAKLETAGENDMLGAAVDIAESPQGPWHEFGYGALFADDKMVKELPGPKDIPIGFVRSSKSEVRIGVDISTRFERLELKQSGPCYLRVRQKWFKVDEEGNRTDLTEEITSNTWTSSKGKLFGGREDGDGPPAKSLLGSINVRLGLAEQDYDVKDAVYKVSVGGWTGHFYSMPAIFPWDPHGTTVSVTATGEGATATESFNIVGQNLDTFKAWQEAEEKKAEQAYQQLVAANNAKITQMKNQVAEKQARVAKVQGMPAGWDAARSHVEDKVTIVSLNNWIKIYETIFQPAAADYRARQIAVTKRDWSSAYDLTKARIATVEAQYDAELKNHAEVCALRSSLYNHPGVPNYWVASEKQRQQNRQKQLQDFKDSAMTINNEHLALFEYAYFAGNSGELEAGIRKLIELRSKSPNKTTGKVHVPEIRNVAFRLVTLTDNGALGASLLREQAKLSGAKPPWPDGRGAPKWWPDKSN